MLGCGAASVPRQPEATLNVGGCSLSSQPPQRLTLTDGSRVLVDATGMAARGGDVLILGSQVHAFGASEQAATQAIGLLRRESGEVGLVPSPLPEASPRIPQTVAAADGGWHVFFVTGISSPTLDPVAYDTAGIWYGHYDGETWSEVQQVTQARGAYLTPRRAGNPVESDQGVAFAFPFDRSVELRSNAEGNQGVVMLLKGLDRWTVDTLSTSDGPRSLQLSAADRKLRMSVAKSYFADRRPHGPALFTVEYDGRWQTPRLLYDPSPDYVTTLMAPAGENRRGGLMWQRAQRSWEFGQEWRKLEWGLVSDEGEFQPMEVADVEPWHVPAVVNLDVETTVLLSREGESRERLAVHVVVGTEARHLGVLSVPLMNFTMSAVPLPDGRILALSGGPDPDPEHGADVPFATFLTEVLVRCVR